MTRPSLLFLKNRMVNDEMLKVVKEYLIHIPTSREVGSTITQLINKSLVEIEACDDFITACRLALKYTALRKLRTANVSITQFPGLRGVRKEGLGRQVILENQYVSYDYTEGVWTYKIKSKSKPQAQLTLSKQHKNNHTRISKMLTVAYPVKIIDRPYVICEDAIDESMLYISFAEMNDYIGFLKEEKKIMVKLNELYKIMRGIDKCCFTL